MASSGHSPENDPLENPQRQVSKNVVEMNDLETSTERTAESHTLTHPDTAVATSSSSGMLQPTTPTDGAEATQNPTIEAASTTEAQIDTLSTEPPAAQTSTAPELSRLNSVAIGPSTDTTLAPSTSVADTANPVCSITLLLTSGARHPYKLDEKYLTKRNVDVPGVTESGKKDPFSISVYTLKELILREWREEWEAQPSSPSSIRLIHFGRLLDDKAPLKGMKMRYPV
jgi:Ubiquitin-2 like Rad60 SUMO-like